MKRKRVKWNTKSNGSGKFGEPMSVPAIGYPAMGHTQTFLSMGSFETEYEAKALMKYVQTKFEIHIYLDDF